MFVFKRLFFLVLLLFASSFACFALVYFSKTSPAYASSFQASAKFKKELEESLNLDKPLLKQYKSWLEKAVKGDFGSSLLSGQSVASLLKEPFLNTLLLAFCSLFSLSFLALILALLSLYYKNSLLARLIHFISLSFFALPSFALSLCLILFFAVFLQILPSSGAYDIGFENDVLNRANHLILPTLALVLSHLAVFLRFSYAALEQSLNQGFIQACFARGLSKQRVYFYLVPLHALGGILTYFAASFVSFLSNAYIIEAVFLYEGLGALALKSMLFKDYPVLLAIILLSIILVFVINFCIEVLLKLVFKRQSYV